MCASYDSNGDLVKYLIEGKVDLNCTDNQGVSSYVRSCIHVEVGNNTVNY